MKPLPTLLAVAALASGGLRPPPATAADIDFNRDVRPILADTCFPCHGFDAKARKAKLRLDTPDGAFAERDAGPPVKPGDPKASTVWERITSADPDVVMPPPASNKKLTAAQKDVIRKWIEQGAKYQKHWSFEPVRRPSVPGDRNPIDAFLLARMKKEGLTPRPQADKETLIRRAAFALTGLPPTVAEVDQFLADKSPAAYEAMVDRYLASPRYGEEMARHWLDVARYADTHGLHLDNERQLWPYRDWVVRAFNSNLPFDRFTVEQLAGDLLPNPTTDQLTATGFNRCNVTTGEGGSIEAEWAYRNAVDRAATAAQAWLGLTAGCAVCHDHKFDPISAKEFYSLYAFFYSSADPPLDDNIILYGPTAKLPSAAQRAALDAATKAETAARKALEAAAVAADYREPTADPVRVTDILIDDAFPLAATDRNTTRNPADWVTDPPFGAKSGRRVLRQANSYFHEDMIQLRLRQPLVPAGGRVEAWVWLDPKHPPAAVALAVNGKKAWWGRKPEADSPYAGGGMGHHAGPRPQPGGWVLLSVPAADLGLKDGQPIKSLTLQEYGGVAYWDAVAVSGEGSPAADPLASFRAWWKGVGGFPPPELPAELHPPAAGKLVGPPTREEVAGLRGFWLAHIARPAT
ncbi:MAG: DUF1549 domain-containing protein, partial [Gemmataceae bacterium]|nr:DUF1549 domain-containing protein [Gemmataceae bacterium]